MGGSENMVGRAKLLTLPIEWICGGCLKLKFTATFLKGGSVAYNLQLVTEVVAM